LQQILKKFEELNKSISESETKNLENKQKVGDLSSKNEMMSLEIENLKNQLKQKDQLIGQQSNQIKELNEQISTHLEKIGGDQKALGDLHTKMSQQKSLEFENNLKAVEDRLQFEVQKGEQLLSKLNIQDKRAMDLETANLALLENEKKISLDKHNYERELKEKINQLSSQKEELENSGKQIEKLEKEIRELKEKS